MNYILWYEVEYEGWKRVDCEDLKQAQEEVMKLLMQGKEPLLTVEVPYDFNVKIKEDKIGEATESKAKRDRDTGAKGKSKVRPGDADDTPSLDKGSGDNRPGDSVPGK